MSFTEKLFGLLNRPNQPGPGEEAEVPSYLKILAQLLGIVGSFFAILCGLYNSLSIIFLNESCTISGILQILVGFTVMAIEAPCTPWKFTTMAKERPLWNRALLYCLISIFPIILCLGLGSLFGCGLIFGTGVIYGMISLGKKASREDMAAAATSPNQMQTNNNGQVEFGINQNISLMEETDTWRAT